MCNDIEVELVNGTYTITQADEDAIGAGSTDNCGINASFTGTLPTTFTIADIGENLVAYGVTDNCGNTASCVATVTVLCPLVVDCSNIVDQTLTCRADLPPVDFNLPIITESCGDVTQSALTIIPGNSGCPGDELTITRTYFISDAGGNSAECMQTFTIASTDGPTFTFCPSSTTVDCGDDTSEATLGTATATADCSAPTVVSADVITPGCGATSIIVRTWTATDFCNRTATCSQTITVQDNVPPVITCPANVTIECDADISPMANGMATATDNCGGMVDITFSDAFIAGTVCPQAGVITRTWTAVDDCGLSATCVQMITILSLIHISEPTRPY